MTFLHTRNGIALVTTCQLCGMTSRSLSESAIYLTQRGHTWQECARRRAEAAQAVSEPDDVECCPEGHERAGNTSTDKSGYIRCLACRREDYAARKLAQSLCATTVFGVVPGVEQGTLKGHKAAPITSRGLTAKTVRSPNGCP